MKYPSYAEFEKEKLELFSKKYCKNAPHEGPCEVKADLGAALREAAQAGIEAGKVEKKINPLDTIDGFKEFPNGNVRDVPHLALKINEIISAIAESEKKGREWMGE